MLEAERWQAIRNPIGQWIVVDEQGEEPLRSPDRIRRVSAAFLAAAAPMLLVHLQELTRRLEYLETGLARDDHRIFVARLVLGDAAVPNQVFAEEWKRRDQLDLDLAA